MGGKALKTIQTRRYNKDEFEKVKILVGNFNLFSQGRIHVVDCYFEKETFGDIDVLVEMTSENSVENILKNIKYNEIHRNGNVVSFDVNNNFQCDLIKVKSEDWLFAKVFYAYNDLGLILGRMTRNLGFTFGFDGLKYKVYSANKTSKLGEIFLTKNPQEAFEFLDLNWNRFLKGFNTMTDVFDYVFTSKFAVARLFDKDFQNSSNKRKDAKRQSVTLAEKYVKLHNDTISYQVSSEFKDNIVEILNNQFPKVNLKIQIQKLYSNYDNEKLASEIFSANDIMNLIKDLQGAKLGQILNLFKKRFNNYTMERILYGKEIMQQLFLKFYDS